MTVDRAHLRKTLVDGWPLGLTVQIRVGDLKELLDELDSAPNIERVSGMLKRLVEQSIHDVKAVESRARGLWADTWAEEAEALAQELGPEHAAKLRALVLRARGEL